MSRDRVSNPGQERVTVSDHSDLAALGPRWDGRGARFTLCSEHAERIELCLFDEPGAEGESRRVDLGRLADGLWETYLSDVQPGQLYGFRAHGPWDPDNGHWFNAAKLLVDPAAAALCGRLSWHEALSAFDPHAGETVPSSRDSAPFVPKSVLTDASYDWQDDRPPSVSWEDTVLYECHVRGLTRLHPEVPAEQRGTYLGLCHASVIQHLQSLGVTTVQLMPVQHFVSEEHLQRLGLSNYFGYNPLAFFAPHAGYASGDRGQQVEEFKTLVRTLHGAGLEVVLDVVFNHTAEGNHRGPTLSLRGIDNRNFYRLRASEPRLYENLSGCGNTLHFGRPAVVDLVLACLRYWVIEMHVDGFRFDLAPVIGRDRGEFDPEAAIFRRIREDPVLAGVKLIAEPWDVAPNGYQLGRFPAGWHEWNDQYRDTVRAFWRGDPGLLRPLSDRLQGSPSLFGADRNREYASVNFVTSHDGFTLHDLVSFRSKQNWDNGEDNRDGHETNLSANWGTEGPTESAEIRGLRNQIKRNFLATLAFSQGVPMLAHGDEMGRTQSGNNNAYCHDSERTWVRWDLSAEQRELLSFTQRAFELRKSLGCFDAAQAEEDAERQWLSAHAAALTGAEWQHRRTLPFGRLWLRRDLRLLLVFNADVRGHLFELPDLEHSGQWRQLINTARPGTRFLRGRAVRLAAHSLMLLRFDATAAPRT